MVALFVHYVFRKVIPMKKVIVIGCPGAGKSTFARKLRDVTGLPLYYLDMLWHKPDRTNIAVEEFDLKLKEILAQDAWIIDGNYQRTLAQRLGMCDTVFFLDFPVELCMKGAQARIGIKREEMPWVEHEFDPEFRQWILDFPERDLPQIRMLLENCPTDKQIVIFHSHTDVDDWLDAYKESKRSRNGREELYGE